MALDLKTIEGFQWDSGNSEKNKVKHNVTTNECEEVFVNLPLLLADDSKHSQEEKRYYVLGQTNKGRRMFISFTVRQNQLRVISARDMNRKERAVYEKELTQQENSKKENP
jgi:uncharacterized DUF497 family protein